MSDRGFANWWKSVEGWKTEGGSGESKARAAWIAAHEIYDKDYDALKAEINRNRLRLAALDDRNRLRLEMFDAVVARLQANQSWLSSYPGGGANKAWEETHALLARVEELGK